MMIKVDYSPEFSDRRNPLVPKVNADSYADVLKSVGIPDKDIPNRVVKVSSKVPFHGSGPNKEVTWADFNPRNNLTTLYPGAGYPVFFGNLASSLAWFDKETAFTVAQEATEEYHMQLRKSLVHEARHDGDNYMGIDFGPEVVRDAFTLSYFTLGLTLGCALTATLFPESQPLIHGLVGVSVGTPLGLMAGYDRKLHYKVDPIEIRARRYEQKTNEPKFLNLVDTVPNPKVDLDYVHDISRGSDPILSISNRQILDLRFGN